MSKAPLRIAFFWHMHQPYYKEDDTGIIEMPWVFLHALKDYYEMIWHLKRFPSLKATFNLSPALLEQLKLYEKHDVNDRLLNLLRRRCDSLDEGERRWVMRFAGYAHYDHQIRPMSRYLQLYELSKERPLSDGELCEIEVLFLLSWCGNALRSENPVVASMIEKGEGFGEEEKNTLIDALIGFIRIIVPEYRKMMESGQISLAINPMYHPIMPLLMDMKNAVRSRPGTQLPSTTCVFEEDAYRQLENGIGCFRERFGCDPHGIWPSEGSVNDTTLQAYGRYALGYAATDEEILFATLNNYDRKLLYSPYRFRDEKGVLLVFRDKRLSDKIGFHYSSWDSEAATEDFMGSLRAIYEEGENPLVSVILDGENAWEFYPNNGMDFFNLLYRKLEQSPWCQTVHLDELAKSPQKVPILSGIHPGSWIYRDFSTWIGQRDKNRAWEMLCQTHLVYQRHADTLTEEVRAKIEREFLIAEGSDWFWWYGTDHESEYADMFDNLFRQRLMRIYRYLSLNVPLYLLRPNRSESTQVSVIPTEWISPSLSAEEEPYFEWYGSGIVHEPVLTNVMDTSEKGVVRSMRYGFDHRYLYLSLEGKWDPLRDKKLIVRLVCMQCETLEIPLMRGGRMDRRNDGAAGIIARSVQLRVPLEWVRADETFSLQVEVLADGQLVSRFPRAHASILARYIERAYDWYI